MKCGCNEKDLENFLENPNSVNLRCSSTWELICTGNVKGCFQIDGNLGRHYCKKIKPVSIEELSDLIALIRPGCLEAFLDGKNMTDHYVDRKAGTEEVPHYHPIYDEIMKNTYGILIYQEQAIQIAEQIAGFDKKEADILRKCLTGDTLFISKTRGPISINRLLETGYQDEEFLTIDENGKSLWGKIKNIWHSGKKPTIELTDYYGNKIRCTKNHQFLTNYGWKDAGLLDNKDYLCIANNTNFHGKYKISNQLAIIIAGLLTEGYIPKNGKYATFVNFDKKMMRIFCQNFKQIFEILPKKDKLKRVAILNKSQRDFIAKHMKPGLSGEKEIPDAMMSLPLSRTKDFLSFMLAAECGISKHGQLEFSSKSLKMITQVQQLLRRYGVLGCLRDKFIKNYGIYYRLYINERSDQKIILDKLSHMWPKNKKKALSEIIKKKSINNFSNDIIPRNIINQFLHGLNKKTKKQVICSAKEGGSIYTSEKITRKRMKRIVSKSADKSWIDSLNNNIRYQTVKVQETGLTEDVFDFTMEDSSNPQIVANGFIVHNSIGKKLPEEIAKVQKLFLEKGLPFGVASEEQLKEIFSWIKASQRYSFNACITPDTLVELEGGSRISIDELKIGSMINSPFGFVKVLNKYENGIREVFCVELESGLKINATLDHKFLCKYNEPYNMYTCGKEYSLRDILKYDLEIYTQHGLEKIDQVTRMAPTRVVDIEVDHHQHIFYGNGIATSNSHSCAYAYNAYISAYLKTHFPYRFFLSYLQHANDKPDAHEEISELITDARKFSITVQGPRIEHLKEVFYKDNENIRFGLQNIKSVGNSAFSKLPPEIPASWNTFLFFLAPKVNSKAVESLIGAGALSSYGIPRIRMLYELDKFLSLTDKEQDAIREVNPPTLLEGLDYLMKNKKYHNVRRLQYLQEIYKLLVAPPTKLEDNPDWLVQQENTLLGYPISASRIENFQTSRSNCTCKEFPTSELAHYSIVAEVKNRKEIVCKKGKWAGQKMAFLTIDDGTDAMEAVVFPKSYEEFSYLLSPGRIVLLKGTKDKERSSLIINKVFD